MFIATELHGCPVFPITRKVPIQWSQRLFFQVYICLSLSLAFSFFNLKLSTFPPHIAHRSLIAQYYGFGSSPHPSIPSLSFSSPDTKALHTVISSLDVSPPLHLHHRDDIE